MFQMVNGIIILDVSINGENGIEIAKRLRKIGYYGNITFWTKHKEYVFDALDVLPVHYIIKGSEHGRMYSVVEQTLENIREKTLTIKNKDYFHRAEFRRIEYIESQNKYIMIHCTCGISHKERGKRSKPFFYDGIWRDRPDQAKRICKNKRKI